MTVVSFVQAAHIMERLEAHPCSIPFKTFDQMDPHTKQKYFSDVQQPMSIGIINKKLERMDYETPQQWERDMVLIADNAAAVFGRYSALSFLAQELLRLFDKEYVNFVSFNQTKWSRLFGEISHRIQFTLNKAPIDFRGEMLTSSLIHNTVPTDDSEDEEGPVSQPKQKPKKKIIIYDDDENVRKAQREIIPQVTEDDVNRFMTAISEFSSLHDVRALAGIIEKYQPDLITNESEAEIDFAQLAPTTISELIKYAKDRYAKLKKEYPA